MYMQTTSKKVYVNKIDVRRPGSKCINLFYTKSFGPVIISEKTMIIYLSDLLTLFSQWFEDFENEKGPSSCSPPSHSIIIYKCYILAILSYVM